MTDCLQIVPGGLLQGSKKAVELCGRLLREGGFNQLDGCLRIPGVLVGQSEIIGCGIAGGFLFQGFFEMRDSLKIAAPRGKEKSQSEMLFWRKRVRGFWQ